MSMKLACYAEPLGLWHWTCFNHGSMWIASFHATVPLLRLEICSANFADKNLQSFVCRGACAFGIPDAYATNATKIRLAISLPHKSVQEILDRFVAGNFIAALYGLSNDTVYRITADGLKHLQRDRSAGRAQAPRLPVESDRVHAVPLIRDRSTYGVLNGPGSAAHHFVLRCARDTDSTAWPDLSCLRRASSAMGTETPQR